MEPGWEVVLADGHTLSLTNPTSEDAFISSKKFGLRIKPKETVIIMLEVGYKSLRKDAASMKNLRSWGVLRRILWALSPRRFSKYEMPWRTVEVDVS